MISWFSCLFVVFFIVVFPSLICPKQHVYSADELSSQFSFSDRLMQDQVSMVYAGFAIVCLALASMLMLFFGLRRRTRNAHIRGMSSFLRNSNALLMPKQWQMNSLRHFMQMIDHVL